jgi:trehalose synthase
MWRWVLKEAEVASLDPRRFEGVLDPALAGRFVGRLEQAAKWLAGRRLWHVNSTDQGGGVAEMLRFSLGYLSGAGIDTRWAVIAGNEPFFDVTKRLHHLLHGEPGDGGDLGQPEWDCYEQTLQAEVAELEQRLGPDDVVVLHDPQTLGLAGPLRRLGVPVIWSCHVGVDQPNELARAAWDFLRDHVQETDAYVFSRRAYCWEGLGEDRLAIIPPCIDAFAPKNQLLADQAVDAILAEAGILDGASHPAADPTFHRLDGSRGRVERHAELLEEQSVSRSTPLVVQVSRWDRLKDPLGVLQGFVDHVNDDLGAHLVLAGPAADSVHDDPEGEAVLQEVRDAWTGLPHSQRARVHLACIPMDDLDENGAIVNALQRRADVIVQKSLAEGFGLTVTEGMWKARPVVASSVGGIKDQITHGETGLLLDDPEDLPSFGSAVERLLVDRELAQRVGAQAHRRVCDDYLAPRRLTQELDLIQRVAG